MLPTYFALNAPKIKIRHTYSDTYCWRTMEKHYMEFDKIYCYVFITYYIHRVFLTTNTVYKSIKRTKQYLKIAAKSKIFKSRNMLSCLREYLKNKVKNNNI